VDTPLERAEHLLREVTKARTLPPEERVAWRADHARELAECIQSLLAFHAGYAADAQKTSSLALKLLKETDKLLSGRGDYRSFVDGTAPRLRLLAEELRQQILRGIS
jgi:hypothetical protein